MFSNEGEILGPTEKSIDVLLDNLSDIKLVRLKKSMLYNCPCSFDIETSSFYLGLDGKTYKTDDEKHTRKKCAIMYAWALGLNGNDIIIGRTWDEFLYVINTISKKLKLNDKKRLVIYVHNLSYEFQFMRKYFEWSKVFSVDVRKPIYAITDNGIEFRDSYILSSYNLAKLGDELQKYSVKKMVGDLDYSLIRHSETPMTQKELHYLENDIRVVMSYIQEKIENEGNIGKIPYTNTGYVRRFCKDKCLYADGKHKKNNNQYIRYRNLMKNLTLSANEYRQAKRAFQGGFTHCSPYYSGKTLCDVASYDFTSSYPTVMIAELFPMSQGTKVHPKSFKEIDNYIKYYCCMFDVEIIGLTPKVYFENPISLSRCYNVENPIVNNGRVVSADKLRTTLTEQDYLILKDYYTWDKFLIADFRIYKKGYLPTPFIKSILELYQNKTKLKGVKGKEVEYLKSKGMVNSCYGMAVTDIVRDENAYIEDWEVIEADVEEQIYNYNNSKTRFLYYLWGVWVTAYARRNLFSGISEFKTDYVYSDTDSIKVLNYKKHEKYIQDYNNSIIKKLKMACDFHKINYSFIAPTTIKGIKKPLGVWDFEGIYKRFKSLGAKRYLVETEDGINMTVAGVNKKTAVPYLIDRYKDKVFENFSNGLTIPNEYTGKNTHTYIDDTREGLVKDYKGKYLRFKELSAVHLENASFTMSLAQPYIEYLKRFMI